MLHFGSRYAWPVVNRCIDILPEPWTLARGSASKHIGPWSTDLGSGTASRVQSFSARASRAPNRCYWGWLLDLDQIGSRGGAWFSRGLRLGPRTVMDEESEALGSEFSTSLKYFSRLVSF